jgi:glutamate N-acetyltransferase/amino-acid N-acetyltransferase
VAAGIKASGRPDVALVVADDPATAAGLFTRSRAASAPVRTARAALLASGGRARAVLVSAGNANAATGSQGLEDARLMAETAAAQLDLPSADVLVCSTGVIGVPLPMPRVLAGVEAAAAALDRKGGQAAAGAICTTDAAPKEATRSTTIAGQEVRIGGMAKGAGMIRPDLGTLIVVLTTDAVVPAERLDRHLRQAVEQTFNRITVDGCTSTSDACLLLAGGRSGVVVDGDGDAAFVASLADVCAELALAVVHDGEGARRIGRWSVTGARSDADARAAAFAVAEDQLVRCALHGADPNWGRIVAALGRVDVDVDFDRLAIDVGDVELVRGGVAVDGAAAEAAGRAAAADEVPFHIDLGRGRGTALVLGSDLSPAYVRANSEYTT